MSENKDAFGETPAGHQPVGPTSELHRMAQVYAKKGLAIFPLTPGTKVPLSGSNGFSDATRNRETIDRIWSANPNCNIGAVPASIGCTVIDADEKDGRNGRAHFDDFVRRHTGTPAPQTKTVQTISSPPGAHLWYTGTVVRDGPSGLLGEGIDVKCRNGYVVMPPSVVDGREYRFIDARDRADLPKCVADELATNYSERSKRQSNSNLVGEPIPRLAFENLLEFIDAGKPRGGWIEDVASIRSSPVVELADGKWETLSEMEKLGIACKWSSTGANYTDDGAVESVFWSMPPVEGGRGLGSLIQRARAAGYVGPITVAEWQQFKAQARDARADSCHTEEGPGPQYDQTREILILDRRAPLVSAERFVERCFHRPDDGRTTLIRYRDDFYVWDRTHYRRVEDADIRAQVYPFLDAAVDNGKPFRPNRNKVADVTEALKARTNLSSDLEAPCWLPDPTSPNELLHVPNEMLPCRNGLLDLRTGMLVPHTPQFLSFHALLFDYDSSAPEPQEFQKFLASIWQEDQEAIETLQEIFGYFLCGDLRQQKIFLLVGPKRAGKGTITRILRELLGNSSVVGPTLSSLGQNFGMEPLIGKRAAIIEDARLGGASDEKIIVERLLTVSGEGTLTIDRKYKSAWHGILPVRFLIVSNELPRFSDASGALAGRFVTLNLTRSFYGYEDLGLVDRILPELPGILNWALEGWRRLQARGHFIIPKSSAEGLQQLEELASPVKAFVIDECEVGPGRTVAIEELYARWMVWCQKNGHHPGSQQTFGRNLAAVVPGLNQSRPRIDGGRVRYYQGIGLRQG